MCFRREYKVGNSVTSHCKGVYATVQLELTVASSQARCSMRPSGSSRACATIICISSRPINSPWALIKELQ
jgi:hypothetical protein